MYNEKTPNESCYMFRCRTVGMVELKKKRSFTGISQKVISLILLLTRKYMAQPVKPA